MFKRKLSLIIALIMMITCINGFTGAYASSVKKGDEMRGMWVASVVNLDYPKVASTDSKFLQDEAITLLDRAKSMGINAVFLQVRPASDALYKSSLFPYSKYLTGTQGLAPINNFDPLKFWIDEAHKRDIELHAWINPYRVTKFKDGEEKPSLEKLAPNNPARLNPNWCVKHGDDFYFDPGLPEVRNLVINGISEILNNYDVDGIHFDDYFYPSSGFDDSASFKKYAGKLSLEDWRVSNVNTLVSEVSKLVKTKPGVSFGISPFGIWKNIKSDPLGSNTSGSQTYFQHYADTRAWVKNKMVDYIAPQIYWEFGHSAADYKTLVDWWCDVVKGTGVKLYIGLADYKVGSNTSVWKDEAQIIKQMDYNRTKPEVDGEIHFRMRTFDNYPNFESNLGAYYSSKPIASTQNPTTNTPNTNTPTTDTSTTPNTKPPIVDTSDNPSLSKGKTMISTNELVGRNLDIKLTAPNKSYIAVTKPDYKIQGFSNPKFPLYLDGNRVNRNLDGSFTLDIKLKYGDNYYSFKNGNSIYSFIIEYYLPANERIKSQVILSDTYAPFYTFAGIGGESIELKCVAPPTATVSAYLGDLKVDLVKSDRFVSGKLDMSCADFKKSVNLPKLADGENIKYLNQVKYIVKLNNKEYTVMSNGTVTVLGENSNYYAKVEADIADNYYSISGNEGSAHVITYGGLDDITGIRGEYVRLGSGFFVKNDKVSIFAAPKKISNTIEYLGVKSDDKLHTLMFKTDENVAVFTDLTDSVITLEFPLTSKLPNIPKTAYGGIISAVSQEIRGNRAIYKFNLTSMSKIDGFYTESVTGGINFHFKKHIVVKNAKYPLANVTIVLDPGHGGDDPGTNGFNAIYPEKVYVMEATNKLRAHLERMGATVYMTRYKDEDLFLVDRLKSVFLLKPDLFVSIHANATAPSRVKTTKGFSVYYKHDFALPLSLSIRDNVVSTMQMNDMKVNRENFYVVRGTWCPAMLLEMGFLTHPDEYLFLKDPEKQEIQTAIIANSIAEYFRK